jgi:hypothetical protein
LAGQQRDIFPDFTQISEELRSEAKRKYSYVNLILSQYLPQRTQASLQPIIEKVAAQINDANPRNWLSYHVFYPVSPKNFRSPFIF